MYPHTEVEKAVKRLIEAHGEATRRDDWTWFVDELYTDSSVRPIEGGDYADVPFLKTNDGSNPRRRAGYNLPLAFQAPVSSC